MAAVFALVLLPVIASVGFFVGALSTATLATALAGLVFVALAMFVFGGALRVVHDVETDH